MENENLANGMSFLLPIWGIVWKRLNIFIYRPLKWGFLDTLEKFLGNT